MQKSVHYYVADKLLQNELKCQSVICGYLLASHESFFVAVCIYVHPHCHAGAYLDPQKVSQLHNFGPGKLNR